MTKRHLTAVSLGLIVATSSLVVPSAAHAACKWTSPQMVLLPGTLAEVMSISAASASDVWAVGFYDRNGKPRRDFAEHWDGHVWKRVPVPGSELDSVRTFSSQDAWAVGYTLTNQGVPHTLALRWNGSSWLVIPTPKIVGSRGAGLSALAGTSPNDMWATGGSGDINNPDGSLSLTEHWNGSAWAVVQSPSPGTQNILQGAFAASPTDVWAVGGHSDPGGFNSAQLIEHWNGSNWAVVAPPNLPGQSWLTAVGGSSSSDIWAVGSLSTTTQGTMTEHWDGANWTVVPSPNDGTRGSFLYGVVSEGLNDAVAVGSSFVSGNYKIVLVERWNGTKWSIDRSADLLSGAQLNSISDGARDELWAAGYDSNSGPYDEFRCNF